VQCHVRRHHDSRDGWRHNFFSLGRGWNWEPPHLPPRVLLGNRPGSVLPYAKVSVTQFLKIWRMKIPEKLAKRARRCKQGLQKLLALAREINDSLLGKQHRLDAETPPGTSLIAAARLQTILVHTKHPRSFRYCASHINLQANANEGGICAAAQRRTPIHSQRPKCFGIQYLERNVVF
jgi:hypothetical protein